VRNISYFLGTQSQRLPGAALWGSNKIKSKLSQWGPIPRTSESQSDAMPTLPLESFLSCYISSLPFNFHLLSPFVTKSTTAADRLGNNQP